MNITQIPLRTNHGWVERSYTFTSLSVQHAPRAISFSVPEEFSGWISDRMEAPVLAGVFLAMAMNEPLYVDQPISARFHYGLRQVMKYFHMWYPERFSMIDIHAPAFDEPSPGPSVTCACFSGGIDSFYTLLHHRSDSEPLPAFRISHGLFVHGFDIPLSDESFYEHTASQLEPMLAGCDVRLVRCRTNLKDVVEHVAPWLTIHGLAILACAHFLGQGIRRFIIPSTNRFSLINPPIGSNPITDPQLITGELDVFHHGCEASRIEKIMALADWPIVQKNLRVCFQKPGSHLNCGKCPKCQKVMLPLWLSGKLDHFTTFPPGFDPSRVDAKCFSGLDHTRYAPELSYTDELTKLALKVRPEALSLLPTPKDSSQASSGWKARFERWFC